MAQLSLKLHELFESSNNMQVCVGICGADVHKPLECSDFHNLFPGHFISWPRAE